MPHLLTRLRRVAAAAGLVFAAMFAAAPAVSAKPLALNVTCDVPGRGYQPIRLEVDLADTLHYHVRGVPFRVTALSGAALDELDPAVSATLQFSGVLDQSYYGDPFSALSEIAVDHPLEGPVDASPVRPGNVTDTRFFFLDLYLRLSTSTPDGSVVTDKRGCKWPLGGSPSTTIPIGYAIPQPSGLRVTRALPTALSFAWEQSGVTDARFEVDVLPTGSGGSYSQLGTTATEATATKLLPGTTYWVFVHAFSASGESWSDPSFKVTTPLEPLGAQSFRLSGVTAIPKLFQGNASVSGALGYSLNADGSLADTSLKLDPVTVPLVIERNLPVTAKLTFLTAAKPTGTLKDGVLKFAAAIRVKVTDARLFGTVPIATGSNCQARNLTRFSFTSPVGFTRDLGGSMMSGYEFGDLVGCTGLNGLLSRETTSRFNTIKVEASPAAS